MSRKFTPKPYDNQHARGVARLALHRRRVGVALGAAALCVVLGGSAVADKIKQPVAVFSGLDKITGRIITFEVATNETVQFGSLQITERVCYSRPPTEAPQTDTFVEVENIDADKQYKRVFTGWMFAGSPSLHALDHPVYDIWLLRCKGPGELIATPPETAATETPSAPPGLKPLDGAKPQDKPQQDKPKAPATAAAPQPGAADSMDNAPIEVGPPPGFNAAPAQPGSPPPANFEPAPSAPNDDN